MPETRADTYPQLISHLTGDYLFQSHWMATHKVRDPQNPFPALLPAALHALAYTSAFLPLTRSPRALTVIATTHFVIDHFRLAIPLNHAKNALLSPNSRATNPTPDPPPGGLQTALMILSDNTLHLAINYLAIKHLPPRRHADRRAGRRRHPALHLS